ncbi:MAG: sigma-54 interaction domain-containing protein, partial [Bacillota bacterium]
MKNTTLVAGSKETISTLQNQIYIFIPKKMINLKTYALDQVTKLDFENNELIIFSSLLVYNEVKDLTCIPENCKTIIGNRTLNFNYIERIISIEENTQVLLVNDLKETCKSFKKSLINLGIDHLNFTLYYPNSCMNLNNIHLAITPGEKKHVPKSISKTIDLGPRIFDFTTISKILTFFNYLDQSKSLLNDIYLKKLVILSKNLAKNKNKNLKLKNDLKNILDGFQEGLLAFNQKGYIKLMNNNLKKLLKIRHKKIINTHLKNIIYNSKLVSYLLDSKNESPFILNLDGQEIFVQKISSNASDNCIVSFKYDHQLPIGTQNNKDLNVGHLAKYNFKNIIGNNHEIVKSKEIAKKLSPSDITILIEGDSGTGKELFASAIHNHSFRKSEKFVAINFSALPDDLIESELFGYVSGAFTGAKKEGKKGLFEVADGGTIFLDEIGDASLKVQTRLLRVLEEKEIMPIGSNKIIPINVRIVAATNKNLEKLVNQNKFRKDLYFRLKMGYIHLPSLRERKKDIPIIAKHLANTSSVKEIKLSNEVIDFFINYSWPGNIRELKNIITYMISYSDENILQLKDLPQKEYFKQNFKKSNKKEKDINLNKNELIVLNSINNLMNKGIKPSRKKISNQTHKIGSNLSINQVRRILNNLEKNNLILKKKGRFGTT